jgi:hypothetical protein
MPVMMVAGLYNFITSLDKLMALQQIFIDVLPIRTTTTKTNQVAN